MTEYPEVFEKATGKRLFPGTLNVNVGQLMEVREHSRIHGKELNEVCRIHGT